MTYISISAVDKTGTKTFSASKVDADEKARAVEFINGLENDAPPADPEAPNEA